jgi:hypothetical protein
MPDTLKLPTKAQRAAGLPKTKAEAIKLGINRFIPKDGQERQIRNYGSKDRPLGRSAKVSTRKITRGSKAKAIRARNELLSTPKEADTKAYGKAQEAAVSQGMHAHHKTPIFLTGSALAEMSPERQALYHERYKKAGVPIGNQAENIMAVSELPHAEIHREMGAVQKSIKDLEFNKGGVKFRGSRAIPFVGFGVAAYVAGGQALAGDFVGAGGTLVDEVVGEVGLDITPVASGELRDAPAQHQAIMNRAANPTVADKIIKDPLNELKYAGKQVMGGLKKVAGAIIFGF